MERASAVDIEAIEDQKENIQPIRSGRSAAQLVSLFNPASSSATAAGQNYNPISLIHARKQSHHRFQHLIHILQLASDNSPIPDPQDRALAQDLLKDPLDIYLQYIRWTIESYPAGGTSGESQLIPLLEQVTRKFLKNKRYQHDKRYLKCWIFYASQVNMSAHGKQKASSSAIVPNNTSSKLVLNYLIHHRIGTCFSLLYLEYAKLFVPFERLECNQEERKKLEHVLKFGISQTQEDEQNDELVELLHQIQSIPSKEESSNQGTVRRDAGSKKVGKVGGPKKGKAKMKIFEDVEGHHGATSHVEEVLGGGSGTKDDAPFSLVTKWDNLGTVHSNRKQNTPNPSSWKGQKLPMKLPKPLTEGTSFSSPFIVTPLDRPPAASTRSKIKVYEDRLPDEAGDGQTDGSEIPQDGLEGARDGSLEDPRETPVISPDQLDDLLASEMHTQSLAFHLHDDTSPHHPLRFLSD